MIAEPDIIYLHLLMPTLDELANHGSIMKTHLKVVASTSPSLRAGLSCNLRPFLNQWTVCFSLGTPAGCELFCAVGERARSGSVSATDIITLPSSQPTIILSMKLFQCFIPY